jgi:hypothetical protein
MKKIFIITVTAMVMIGGPSDAAVLAKYDFTGSVKTSSDTDLFSTAPALTDGAGWTSTINTTTGNPAPSGSVLSNQTGSSQALAISGNDYYEFTITPNVGFVLNLTDLTFDYRRFGGGLNATFFVRSSADSFATNLGSASTGSDTFANVVISLSGAPFQNVSSPLTFRLYAFDDMNNAGKGDIVDNITLNGSTGVVPEPGTFGLLAFGAAGLAGVIARRRKKAHVSA